MMLKRKSSQSKRSPWTLLRAGVAGLGLVVGGAAVTAGCLDRPVSPATPKTSNVYVDEIRQTAVDKIDLLFMIDNSISMADKQKILALAVPELAKRLITPICIIPCTAATCTDDEIRDGTPTMNYAVNGECPDGQTAEFQPIKDIHVGVVTSSLGAHGADGVDDICTLTTDNDHAHLLGEIRPDQTPYNQYGFLKWDTTDGKYTPPGDDNIETFNGKFTTMVTSAGEHGCGFEASLESWYRFLIEPEPPLTVRVPPEDPLQRAIMEGVDQTVLDQRNAFLRPDSLVAIVMLSDENDCSIQDEGYGWMLSRSGSAMFRSTSECAENPNAQCCQSCGEMAGRDGCEAPSADPACQAGIFLDDNKFEDPHNLRCYDQKRRFGFDLLYPTQRYVDGLREPTVRKRSTGEDVTNPLFDPKGGNAPRDKGLVFLAGIVGVPWQDISDDASLTGPGLRYKTAAQMQSDNTWALILGDSGAGTNTKPVLPTDPLMHEQPNERTGTNPRTNDAIAPSSSTDQQANKINGHEQLNFNMENQDLQYACIFELEEEVECTEAVDMQGKGCDCFATDLPLKRPLCEPDAMGNPTITQNYAKAYPGLRHLQVLKDFGANSVVASICPKVPTDTANPDYGYNPAVKAIIDRLKDALKGKCLPRPLVPVPEGKGSTTGEGLQENQVPCKVVEAVLPTQGAACACDATQNRDDVSNKALRDAVLTKLKDNGACDTGAADNIPCASYCTCELLQLAGAELQECQNASSPPNVPGYCYVNAAPNEPNVGNPDLVKQCAADSKRLLRFVGNTPAPGAIALVACLGASLGSTE